MAVTIVTATAVMVGCNSNTSSASSAPAPGDTASDASAIPSSAGRCAGPDPQAVASAFVVAVNAHDEALYITCVAPDRSGDEVTVAALRVWAERLAGDNYSDIALPRSATRSALSTPPDPSRATGGPSPDNGATLIDIDVALKPDGNYYVTAIGREVHA